MLHFYSGQTLQNLSGTKAIFLLPKKLERRPSHFHFIRQCLLNTLMLS